MEWLAIAFIAPLLWAIVSIIDNYFVDGIYEDEFDGITLSSLFQLVPWILVPFGLLDFAFSISATPWAIASGFFFLAALFFYFRSLFWVNDSALMQILWSLSVPLVPFFAWLIIDEKLRLLHYLGISIAFLGVLIFSFDVQRGARERLSKVAIPMAWAILFMALSMVSGKKAFLATNDLESNFLAFCFGAVFILFLAPLLDRKGLIDRSRQVYRLSKKHFFIFALAEGLSVAATFASQWAIKLAPAISFVAVIESFVPVFVVAISLTLVVLVRFGKSDVLRRIYEEQLVHMKTKVFATLLIATGVFVIAQ